MEKQLLCTFTSKNIILSTLRNILDTYIILFKNIYLYENLDNRNCYICMYNVCGLNENKQFMSNTIAVHRKKTTNTIYTINALNELIKLRNNGVLDKNFIIDWEDYRDNIFVIFDGELQKIRIRYQDFFSTN